MEQPLISITIKDCRVDAFRASGPGGQKRNKTCSAIRITHLLSGAVAEAKDGKDQHQNKKVAFRRMAESKKFQIWLKIEIAKKLNQLKDIDEVVDQAMKEENLKIQFYKP